LKQCEMTTKQIKELRSRAQIIDPILSLGKAGITPGFLETMRAALKQHQLVKIRFVAFKEERKNLAASLAEKCEAELVQVVGNCAVFFRQT
jgi:RNA-binding protein